MLSPVSSMSSKEMISVSLVEDKELRFSRSLKCVSAFTGSTVFVLTLYGVTFVTELLAVDVVAPAVLFSSVVGSGMLQTGSVISEIFSFFAVSLTFTVEVVFDGKAEVEADIRFDVDEDVDVEVDVDEVVVVGALVTFFSSSLLPEILTQTSDTP